MKNVDTYTKGMLTIIALCLVILTVGHLGLSPNTINPLDTPGANMKYGLVPLNDDGSITVKMSTGDRMDVSIVDINTYDELRVEINGVNTSDELPVNIDEVAGSSVYSSDGIPVHIED